MDESYARWLDASKEYEDVFGDVFPLMQFWGGFDDAVEEIRRCIDAGRPYEPEEGAIY